MINNPPDLDAVLRRLERLERLNRLWKRSGIALLIVAGTLVTIGFQARPSDTVVAKRFMLTDDKGRARGEMTANATDTVLVLSDPKGDNRLTLSVGTFPVSQTNARITLGNFKTDLIRLEYHQTVHPSPSAVHVLNAGSCQVAMRARFRQLLAYKMVTATCFGLRRFRASDL